MDAYARSNTPIAARDRRATPPDVFARIQHVTGITFVWDVCAEKHTSKVPGRCWTKDDDSLSIDWHGTLMHTLKAPPGFMPAVWMNPPYSDPTIWCEKAALEARKGMFVMGLLPDDRSVSWYRDYVDHVAPDVWVPDRRISFHDEKGKPQNGNPKGSVFILWTPWRTRHTSYHRFTLDGMKREPLTAPQRKLRIRRKK